MEISVNVGGQCKLLQSGHGSRTHKGSHECVLLSLDGHFEKDYSLKGRIVPIDIIFSDQPQHVNINSIM